MSQHKLKSSPNRSIIARSGASWTATGSLSRSFCSVTCFVRLTQSAVAKFIITRNSDTFCHHQMPITTDHIDHRHLKLCSQNNHQLVSIKELDIRFYLLLKNTHCRRYATRNLILFDFNQPHERLWGTTKTSPSIFNSSYDVTISLT